MEIEKFIGWIFIIIGFVMLCKFFSILYFYYSSLRTWGITNGVIKKSSIEYFRSKQDSDTEGFKLRVEYVYLVKNKKYIGCQIGKNINLLTPSKSFHIKELQKYTVGNKIDVYYNPKKPSDALVDTEFDVYNLIMLLMSIIAIVIGFNLN